MRVSASEIAQQVEGHVPELATWRGVLAELLSAIPLPNFESFTLLLAAIRRLDGVLPGLAADGLGWPPLDAVLGMQAAVERSAARSRFYLRPDRKFIAGLTGEYGIFVGLLSQDPAPPLALERLRALLLATAWRWRPGHHATALETLAQAIRGLARQSGSGSRPLDQALVSPAALATSASDLAERVPDIPHNTHAELSSVWASHFVPVLRGVGSDQAKTPDNPPLAAAVSGGAKAPEGRSGSERAHPPRLRAPAPRSISFRPADQPRLPGEPDADAHGSTTLVAVRPAGAGLGRAKVARFRATQNIWNRNSLLLTEHVESLTRREAKAAAHLVIQWLNEAITSCDADASLRWTCTALTLFTGRTAAVLRSARIPAGSSAKSLDPNRWELRVSEGAIRFPLPRLENAFVPGEADRHYFEPVQSHLTLPLPAGLTGLLRRASERGLRLLPRSVDACKEEVAAGCRALSSALGLPITPGRLRRTLACLLQDVGADIVATMMIAGDTFGMSDAPLYYRAARESDLQKLYSRATALLLACEPDEPIVDSKVRVGAKNLVTEPARRRLGAILGTTVHAGHGKREQPEASASIHNAMVDHLAGMVLATSGHRPVQALFELSRGDFDLSGQGALFGDKKFDLAHHCRFAGLAPIVSRQVEAYLQHLRSLARRHPAQLQQSVSACLAGDAPLFFRLTSNLTVEPLDLSTWSATLPEEWQRLPRNFSRTLIATMGPELGALPAAVATTLGHYESVGYPFAVDGPTEPILLAAHLAPVLEKIGNSMGWVVRRGLDSEAVADPWAEWGPLQDWRSAIQHAEARGRDLARQQRIQVRACYQSYRVEAEGRALELIARQAPKLAAYLKTKPKRLPPGATLEMLSVEDVEAVLKELRRECLGDEARVIAACNAMSRLLGRARKSWGWQGPVPPALLTLHRAETSPFFPGMMKARAQMEALRSHYPDATAAPELEAEGTVGPRTLAFAHCALTVCLFGFVDDPAQVEGLLARRATSSRSAALLDLLLAQWGSGERSVMGLRHTAATALAALAKRYPQGEPPPRAELDRAMASLLPQGAAGSGTKLLHRLCSTVAVANRIELSGAARLALNAARGSVPATMSEQVALIDGDPVAVLDAEGLVDGAGVNEAVDETDPRTRSPRRRGAALVQYKKLLKMLPSHEGDVLLPKTGVTVTQANREHSRKWLIAEMEAWANDLTTNNLVAALAAWGGKMLAQGTLDEENPALGTVKTYLTTVGGDLVPLAEGVVLSDLDEAGLTQLYLDVVNIKKDSRKALAAREVLHFHSVVAPRFDLADVDRDDFAEFLRDAPQSVDAETIRVQQREVALAGLVREAAFSADAPPPTQGMGAGLRRVVRQAAIAAELTGAAGARIGEPLGMRLKDIAASPDKTLIRLASNRFRRVKTRASRRVVDLSHRVPASGRARIAAWCDAEYRRTMGSQQSAAFLFRSVDQAKRIHHRRAVRDLVAGFLAKATRRKRERVHRLRHLAGTEGLCSVFLPQPDRQRLPWLVPLSEGELHSDEVIFPRDLHRQTCVLGHVRPRTTLVTYCHVPWITRARADAWMGTRLDRWHAAAAMGCSVHNADQIVKRRKPTPAREAWLNHLVPPRQPPAVPPNSQGPAGEDRLRLTDLTTRDVGRLLGWTEDGLSSEAAVLALGATGADLALIRECGSRYASRVGRDFIAASPRTSPKRRTRRHQKANHLYDLWELADQSPDATALRRNLSTVVEAVVRWARFHHRDRIMLPVGDAEHLRELLLHVGHPADRIFIEAAPEEPFVVVRVARLGQVPRYYGRELRRLLGVIWVRDQVRAKSAADSSTAG